MNEVKPKYTYEQLIEKIVRAKVSLEGSRRGHSDTCPVDYDSDYMGPCTCGASGHNGKIYNALEELKL